MKLARVDRIIVLAAALCAAPLSAQQPDPFLWLEDVEGERALKWVEAQNAATIAALSKHANFSLSCYCEDESRCHRSQLRALLLERGAAVEGANIGA